MITGDGRPGPLRAVEEEGQTPLLQEGPRLVHRSTASESHSVWTHMKASSVVDGTSIVLLRVSLTRVFAGCAGQTMRQSPHGVAHLVTILFSSSGRPHPTSLQGDSVAGPSSDTWTPALLVDSRAPDVSAQSPAQVRLCVACRSPQRDSRTSLIQSANDRGRPSDRSRK